MTAVFGLYAIFWAANVVPYFEVESSIKQFSDVVKKGERLISSASEIEDAIRHAGQRRPSIHHELIVLQTWLLENSNDSGNEAGAVYRSAHEAMSFLPTDAFLWLVIAHIGPKFGLSSSEVSTRLALSYQLAPNEGWLASMRNPIFLKQSAELAPGIQEELFSEFVGLVRSGLYDAPLMTLQQSSPSIRSRLLERLTLLEQDRKADFARVLRERNVDDVEIPGVELTPRHQWE